MRKTRRLPIALISVICKVLTVKVYEYAFGQADIGAGSATAMVLFLILLVFMAVYFRVIMREEE